MAEEEAAAENEVGEVAAPPADSPNLAAAKLRYAEFLTNNPLSSILTFEFEGAERLLIRRPWDDKSIAVVIPEEDADFVSALNALFLPPRYTAIYHNDLRVLEVIWTAYKLDEHQKDLEGRKFTLALAGVKHECEFTESSERLFALAKHAMPVEISGTAFRNLNSFNALLTKAEEGEGAKLDAFGRPLSFWIRDVDWDDDKVINLVRHINFYLRYYDAKSPVIEIHPSGDPRSESKRPFRSF